MSDLDAHFFHVNINAYCNEEVQAQKEVVVISNDNHKVMKYCNSTTFTCSTLIYLCVCVITSKIIL